MPAISPELRPLESSLSEVACVALVAVVLAALVEELDLVVLGKVASLAASA